MLNTRNSCYPVILAGGSGTRLWPASRKDYPKQFMKLTGQNSLLQETVLRLLGRGFQKSTVVCSEQHRFLVAEHLQLVGANDASILLEPIAKNTAAAIAVAAWHISELDRDGVMVVMPADHKIDDKDKFSQIVDSAVPVAMENKLVTLGITPSYAETGYGYIRTGDINDKNTFRTVTEFVEKPDLLTAQRMIEEGRCFWNAGVFVFKAEHFLNELEALDQDMHSATRLSVEMAKNDLDFIRLHRESFSLCSDISVDYAVLEKSKSVVMVPFDSGWSDIGSWSAVLRSANQDNQGNAMVGDVIVEDCEDSYIHAEQRLVVAKGLKNIAVVETDDAVMVIDTRCSQEVKSTLKQLRDKNRSELTTHPTCYRPWGHYTSLNMDARFQVKRITVKPGAKLSLQKHYHRSEHWVVVSGTAIVTRDEEEIMLSENESIYIPLGAIHRLHNPGTIPLELIEVQSGSYLGEDDIVRVGDEYGRS